LGDRRNGYPWDVTAASRGYGIHLMHLAYPEVTALIYYVCSPPLPMIIHARFVANEGSNYDIYQSPLDDFKEVMMELGWPGNLYT